MEERRCVGCGDTEEMARLENCAVCQRPFCPDCAHRGLGRHFCSPNCARQHFYGDIDDDEDLSDDNDID